MRYGAIAAGWLADLSLSLLFGGILAAIVGGENASPEEVTRRLNASAELILSSLLVGLSFTGVGGYVAAMLVKERHVEHAIGVGLLSLGFGLTFLIAGTGETPGWATALGLALTVPFAAFGGWFRKRTEVAAA